MIMTVSFSLSLSGFFPFLFFLFFCGSLIGGVFSVTVRAQTTAAVCGQLRSLLPYPRSRITIYYQGDSFFFLSFSLFHFEISNLFEFFNTMRLADGAAYKSTHLNELAM